MLQAGVHKRALRLHSGALACSSCVCWLFRLPVPPEPRSLVYMRMVLVCAVLRSGFMHRTAHSYVYGAARSARSCAFEPGRRAAMSARINTFKSVRVRNACLLCEL